MNSNIIKSENRSCNPSIDDSIKPDFKVFWINHKTKERGHSTFFTYEYGKEIISAVFMAMYPGRVITAIMQVNN